MTLPVSTPEQAADAQAAIRAGIVAVVPREVTLEGGTTEWLPVIRMAAFTLVFNPEYKVAFAKRLAEELTATIRAGTADDSEVEFADWNVQIADKVPQGRRNIESV